MSLYRIDKLFNFEKGTLQSSKCEPGNYAFITASAEWKTHKDFSYDCEALVFAAAASGSLGRTHYVNGKFIASDLCFVLTPKDSATFPIDLRFYHIIFNELRSDIVKNTKAGTSKEAISLGNFSRYELPYFEIEKQIEIKNQFVHSEKTKETLTAELTRQLDLVKQLRQSFLREAMQGKLVPQDPKDEPASDLLQKIKAEKERLIKEKKLKKDRPLPEIKPEEIPFEIPENWVWCRLGKIADLKSGNQYQYDFAQRGTMFVKVGDMNIEGNEYEIISSNNFFKSNEINPRDLIPTKSIIFPKRGGAIATNKRRVVLKEPILVDSNTMAVIPSEEINFKYYFYWFSGIDLSKLGNEGVIPQVNNKDLDPLLFPLPPLPEQHRIVAKLEQLMQLCDDLEQSIRQSKEQTNMLLQAALREALKGKGKIGVVEGK